jgi:hypothetical protein
VKRDEEKTDLFFKSARIQLQNGARLFMFGYSDLICGKTIYAWYFIFTQIHRLDYL